ncbi:hypothetical protein [Candidatus Hakubella thermalkaliphila]|uniref:Uncharacterized protein n=1 Tax=Candidatus Hakubella thermalkaliphila TaxID=2754717 RepID=A0A6V8Q398_9ACTN|nr:hypothetical protein [Candidatus Hakubella thermalkaliphila]GFP39252.1 hypothetical protein HKBW3S47_00951 [Candidatus Hakubella thermalkaliphila]
MAAMVLPILHSIVAVLTSKTRGDGTREPLVLDILKQAYLTLKKDFDEENGGFSLAPKFPQPLGLEFQAEKNVVKLVRIIRTSKNKDLPTCRFAFW